MACTRRVVIYFEPSEFVALKAAAGLTTISTYARSVLLAAIPEPTVPYPNVPAEDKPYTADTPLPTYIPDVSPEAKPLPVEPTQPIRRRECEHGILEGYNCWRCRGKAIVRGR